MRDNTYNLYNVKVNGELGAVLTMTGKGNGVMFCRMSMKSICKR